MSISRRAVAEVLGTAFDISGHRSKHVDEFQGQSFDYVLMKFGTTSKPFRRMPNDFVVQLLVNSL
jgi:protein-tyrosine-phosphatase